jgi:hypothetical protein
MRQKIKAIIPIIALTTILILPYLVFAQNQATDPITRLNDVALVNGPYDSTRTLPQIIGLVINGILSLLGIIFIILVVTAGIKWMTAGGSQEKVKAATTTIQRSVIGLIIIAASWAIWNFILQNLIIK